MEVGHSPLNSVRTLTPRYWNLYPNEGNKYFTQNKLKICSSYYKHGQAIADIPHVKQHSGTAHNPEWVFNGFFMNLRSWVNESNLIFCCFFTLENIFKFNF